MLPSRLHWDQHPQSSFPRLGCLSLCAHALGGERAVCSLIIQNGDHCLGPRGAGGELRISALEQPWTLLCTRWMTGGSHYTSQNPSFLICEMGR